MAGQKSRVRNALAATAITFSIGATVLVAWHLERWASPGLLQYDGTKVIDVIGRPTTTVRVGLQFELSSDRASKGSMIVNDGDAVSFAVVLWEPAECRVTARGRGIRNGVLYLVIGCPSDAEFVGTISPLVPSAAGPVRLSRLP